MKAGKLKHRIKILIAETSKNPMGGASTTKWHEVARLWARFEPLSVRDTITAQAADSTVIARCTVRKLTLTDNTIPGRTYKVYAADEDRWAGDTNIFAGDEYGVYADPVKRELNTKLRVEHRGRVYEIDGDPLPDNDSGFEYVTLMLKGV